MTIIKTNINNINSNFAKFDLSLICEDKYKDLKHVDMVVFTMLKNQESLSINSVKNGSKKYVDSKGYIFVTVSQEKLCKIVRTTKPTLIASLKRLEACNLIQVLKTGNMQCNRIYVGNPESTTTLGEYINKIGIELDSDIENDEIITNTDNVNDEGFGDKNEANKVNTSKAENKASKGQSIKLQAKPIPNKQPSYAKKNKNGINLAKSTVKVDGKEVDSTELDNNTIEELANKKWSNKKACPEQRHAFEKSYNSITTNSIHENKDKYANKKENNDNSNIDWEW